MFNIISHKGNAYRNHNETQVNTYTMTAKSKDQPYQVLTRMCCAWNLQSLLVKRQNVTAPGETVQPFHHTPSIWFSHYTPTN